MDRYQFSGLVILWVTLIQGLPDPFRSVRKRCGRPSFDELRITYGQPARKGAHPWMVSIQVQIGGEWTQNCGGALLDKRWVLTAAHCFKTFKNITRFRLVAGEYGLEQNDCSEQYLGMKGFFQHPDFISRTHENDIALVLADGRFEIGGLWVKPICLPKQGIVFDYHSPCMIAGWGQTKGTIRKEDRKKLLYYNSTILPTDECNAEGEKLSTFPALRYIAPVTNEMICIRTDYNRTAPYRERGSGGTCVGDSGGPLICKNEEKQYLAGVTSWSLSNCGQSHDLFTKLDSHLEWIKGMVRNYTSGYEYSTEKPRIEPCMDY